MPKANSPERAKKKPAKIKNFDCCPVYSFRNRKYCDYNLV